MSRYAEDWVLVAEFMNHPEAELAKNLLESYDVPVTVWADDCGGLSVGQTFIQRVRLYAPGSEQARVEEILGRKSPEDDKPGDRFF